MQSRPYTKRVVRARLREVRLRELGYDTYSAYLSSSAWRDVKARYRASDLPQICMCGETKVQLHHTTYERVGREELEDLIPLCHDCHATAHDLEAAGVIDLDLQGFYYDPERAKNGKMYLAQLAAACPKGEVLRADKRRVLDVRRADQKANRGRAMRTKVAEKSPPTPRAAEPQHMARRTFGPDPVEYEYTPGAYADLELPERVQPEPKMDWRPSAIPQS